MGFDLTTYVSLLISLEYLESNFIKLIAILFIFKNYWMN